MKSDRINEKTNILKLAAGQKVGELKIQRMKELKKIALREKANTLAGVVEKASNYEVFKKEMQNLLGLEGSLFNNNVTVQEKLRTNNLNGTEFKDLINYDKIKYENLSDNLKTLGRPLGIDEIKEVRLKGFLLTSSEKLSLANFLEKYAEDFKYLYELRKKIDLALTLKELESLE
jgi:hypothetical protein